MASTSSTPEQPEDGADTRPESIAPAPGSTLESESASVASVLAPDAASATTSPPAPKKRRKSVRTALRQTLNRSIKQATGRLGDTTDGSNTLAVGSSTMVVETELSGSRAGHLGKKHVRVDVTMSVTDDDTCTCPPGSLPPVPPVTPPVKAPRVWYWWVLAPILGTALLTVTPNEPTTPTTNQPPAISTPAPVVSTKPDSNKDAGTQKPAPTDVGSGKVTTPPPADATTAGGGIGLSTGPVPPPGTPGGQGTLGKVGSPDGSLTSGSPPAGSVETHPAFPVDSTPFLGGDCRSMTGQLKTAPDYVLAHSPRWVQARADTWFVKRLALCGATVQAFDVGGRVMNVLDFGDNMVYRGQRLLTYRANQLQVDHFDASDRFVGRTTFIYAGTGVQRVSTAYKFDSRGHRTFEVSLNRNDDGSIRCIVLWAFGPDDKVLSRTTYSTHEQIGAILVQHFDQFPEITSGTW